MSKINQFSCIRFFGISVFVVGLIILPSCSQDTTEQPNSQEDLKTRFMEQDSLAITRSLMNQTEAMMQLQREHAAVVKEANELASLATKVTQEQIYDVVVMGDCELNMRGISYSSLLDKINKITIIGSTYTNLKYDDGTQVNKPELAFMAGDLTEDRASDGSWSDFKRLMNVFNQKGVYLFPITGNHDWDPRRFSDGSYGYTLSGHQSNGRSISAVTSLYNSALQQAKNDRKIGNFSNIDGSQYVDKSSITWWRLSIDLITAAPVYGFTYKGVDYVLESGFMFQPQARVTLKSFFGNGPAEYKEGIGASYLANRAKRVSTSQRIFIQHYPYNSGDDWWTDNYSGRSASTLRSNFISALNSAKVTAMFSGHNHAAAINKIGNINDYSVGYTGGDGSFIMARISSTRGVLQVKAFRTSDF